MASTITTWADGYGRWYAAVPGDLVDPRRAARVAIRRELVARDQIGPGVRVRIERAPAYWHGHPDMSVRPVFRELTTAD